MKLLKDILYKAGILDVSGSTDVNVSSIVFDSRKIQEACVFVAVKGTQSDGHIFIEQAIQQGAIAIICEDMPVDFPASITFVKVRDSAKALGMMASNFFDQPSSKLKLTGITGTNGKTTTATLLHSLIRSMGIKAGLLSTIQNKINDEVIAATHTTPDPVQLNSLLNDMVAAGCKYAFMEVSSHAVVQERVYGLEFAGGVFTNITHDHLDYHKTFDAYLKAKKTFFDSLPANAFALTNADDKNGAVMLQNTKASKHSYGLKSMSEFKCKLIENHITGLMLNIDGHEILCRLIGSFNAYNLTAIYSTAVLLGFDKLEVLTQLSKLGSVEGRFDYIKSENNITGVVDYAHTPDALENVLNTIRDVNAGKGRIITLVGCGGNRDATKRPLMARIACNMSDKVILTSDNPRNEEPEDILHQMEQGLNPSQLKKAITVVDRKEAIKSACLFAQPGDIILLAGKGHEKYQEIKGVKKPFDDKKILLEMFSITQTN